MAEMTVRVEGGTGGPVNPEDITGATATGISVLTATDAAAARTAIGAGTSSLVVGTAANQAKAGNYQPTAANISDATATGRSVLTAANAAAAQTAIGLTAAQLMLGSRPAIADSTATDVAGLVADFNALLAALSARGVIA